MAEPSQAKPSQATMQSDAPEKSWGQGSAGGRCRARGQRGRGGPGGSVPHARGRRRRCGARGRPQPQRRSLGTDGLAAVQREATQMIKGTERLISERRLKGLNIYIAWLRAVRGETN